MNIDTIINDARDYHLISRSIDKFSPEVLIQLAAVSHANESKRSIFYI